ncbi:MbcA/ParS/Xre antitoxin family protein [Flagellatimonas centrodinii]|uniref:MbcA/ParS/Xre antitoxin family protein n=1 Tax=Flagellatimonas centrodinii TaxID=2806210 RepID=UPI001FED728F|nr:MbcA/ParS/Xre antitoxin family protein [Flagellatimonas centrodinii]ULQ46310.1 MbcA/ParS/Xre antitoxin family protein [Flagellatimonas centrodinii]
MCRSSTVKTIDLKRQPIPESVLNAATDAFGSEAMAYLDAPNYALGGRSPRELLKTTDGQRTVLNEIQAHVGGGPI